MPHYAGSPISLAEDAVLNSLRSTPGQTRNQLYMPASVYIDELELSKLLHNLIMKTAIYKSSNLYYIFDHENPENNKSTEERTAELMRKAMTADVKEESTKPPRVVQVKKEKEIKPITHVVIERNDKPDSSSKPFGSLRRGNVSAKVVFLLFAYRNSLEFSIADICAIIGNDSPPSCYQILLKLVKTGYIRISSGNATNGTFKWNSNHCYPFSYELNTDRFLADHSKVTKYFNSNVEAPVNLGNKEEAIEALKEIIQMHESVLFKSKALLESLEQS